MGMGTVFVILIFIEPLLFPVQIHSETSGEVGKKDKKEEEQKAAPAQAAPAAAPVAGRR